MSTSEKCDAIIKEIEAGLSRIEESQMKNVIDAIIKAKKIFCIGAGRSKLVLSAFCMRLNHLGFEAYVAGGIPCPPVEQGDLVIAASGSGNTPSVLAILNRIKNTGAKIIIYTACPTPSISKVSDTIIEISAPSSLMHKENYASIQIMRTLFEQIVFIIGEGIIATLSEHMNLETIANRHTNLE